MSNLYVEQQNTKADAWEAGGGAVKTIVMQGQNVKCELDGEGVIKNEFLRNYARQTGQ